jgi:hypothetical protein
METVDVRARFPGGGGGGGDETGQRVQAGNLLVLAGAGGSKGQAVVACPRRTYQAVILLPLKLFFKFF